MAATSRLIRSVRNGASRQIGYGQLFDSVTFSAQNISDQDVLIVRDRPLTRYGERGNIACYRPFLGLVLNLSVRRPAKLRDGGAIKEGVQGNCTAVPEFANLAVRVQTVRSRFAVQSGNSVHR